MASTTRHFCKLEDIMAITTEEYTLNSFVSAREVEFNTKPIGACTFKHRLRIIYEKIKNEVNLESLANHDYKDLVRIAKILNVQEFGERYRKDLSLHAPARARRLTIHCLEHIKINATVPHSPTKETSTLTLKFGDLHEEVEIANGSGEIVKSKNLINTTLKIDLKAAEKKVADDFILFCKTQNLYNPFSHHLGLKFDMKAAEDCLAAYLCKLNNPKLKTFSTKENNMKITRPVLVGNINILEALPDVLGQIIREAKKRMSELDDLASESEHFKREQDELKEVVKLCVTQLDKDIK
jgi:hypothetical protein